MSYEAVGVPMAEAGQNAEVWKQRRQAIADRRSDVASLPAALRQPMSPQQLLEQLPSIKAALPNAARGNGESVELPARLRALVEAVPQNVASVKDVFDPRVGSEAPVLLIQDVHMNPEAQRNIASVLASLLEKRRVDVVGVEGAFSAFDFAPVRAFTAMDITRRVADAYLKYNRIAAPSYVGMTAPGWARRDPGTTRCASP